MKFLWLDVVENTLISASEAAKQSSALVLQGLGQRNPELLKEFGPEIAPFVLLATMRKSENVDITVGP